MVQRQNFAREPPLTDEEVRLLRLLLQRAACPGTDFGFSPPVGDFCPAPVTVDRSPLFAPARLCQRWCSCASGGELWPGLASTFGPRPPDPLGPWHLCYQLLARADLLCSELVSQTLAKVASFGRSGMESSPSRDGTEDFAITAAGPASGCDAGQPVYFLGCCPGQLSTFARLFASF